MKTSEELVAERETHIVGKGIPIPVKFKKEVIEFHYESGMFITTLSEMLNLHFTTVHGWKRIYGTGQTHARHGNTTRADLKTKALAVTDELDNGFTTIQIANKYNITRQQYGAWKVACQDRYEEFRELPDGVMWVTKPEKLVYGDKNIRAMRKLLENDLEKIKEAFKLMHKYGELVPSAASKTLMDKLTEDIKATKRTEELIREGK